MSQGILAASLGIQKQAVAQLNNPSSVLSKILRGKENGLKEKLEDHLAREADDLSGDVSDNNNNNNEPETP